MNQKTAVVMKDMRPEENVLIVVRGRNYKLYGLFVIWNWNF